MKHDTDTEQKLAHVVDKLCKQQPLRKAPTDMYARVMREVQLRKSLPWWRKSFLHWPLMMQALFVVAALLTAKGALMLGSWFDANAVATAKTITQESSLVQGSSALLSISNHLSSLFAHIVPSSWMYLAVLSVGAIYLVLIGVGVATYKTLYATSPVAR